MIMDNLADQVLAAAWADLLAQAPADVDFRPQRIEHPPLVALVALARKVEEGQYAEDMDPTADPRRSGC